MVTGRKIVGATNPLQSEPGTVRGDFCIDVGRNLIHGANTRALRAHESSCLGLHVHLYPLLSPSNTASRFTTAQDP